MALKLAFLLHLGGSDVQDIFTTLDDTGIDKDYEIALTKLNECFTPHKKKTFSTRDICLVISRHVCEQTETVGCYM